MSSGPSRFRSSSTSAAIPSRFDSPRAARQRGAVTGLALDAEPHQDLGGGEAVPPGQRLVQFLDGLREELAVLVVAGQTANDQRPPRSDDSPMRTPRLRVGSWARATDPARSHTTKPASKQAAGRDARGHESRVRSGHGSLSTVRDEFRRWSDCAHRAFVLDGSGMYRSLNTR